MKKITLVLFAGLLMMSCGGKKKEAANIEELPIQSNEVFELEMNDEHNAKNSLDYIGKYQGALPLKGDKAVNVTIILADSTYSLAADIDGGKSNSKLENEGKYTWDETGFIISLEGVESPNQYRVVEGALVALLPDVKDVGYRLEKVNE